MDASVRERLERLTRPRSPGEGGTGLTKNELFYSVTTFFENLGEGQPLVVVLEDMHWADTATIDLLEYLARKLERPHTMVVTIRRPQGTGLPRSVTRKATHITVNPLGGDASEELLESVLGAGGAATQVAELALAKAEGNPFFLEDVMVSLIEDEILVLEGGRWRCTQEIGRIEIPDTVEGVLLARIDQLEERSRRLLQEASVVGRTFQDQVLREVTEIEGRIDGLLTRLEDGDLLRYWPALEKEDGHEFKHVLTREVAYNTLLLRRRSSLHQRIAAAIERMYRGRLQSFAELLAYHYEHAGDNELAARYHLMAGAKSAQVHANQEARLHWHVASRLSELSSVWSLYSGGGPPPFRVRLAAMSTQFVLALVMVAPALMFVILSMLRQDLSGSLFALLIPVFYDPRVEVLLPGLVTAVPFLRSAWQ